MNRSVLRGLAASSAGVLLMVLGGILLTQTCEYYFQESISIFSTGLVCTMPRGLAEAAYFLASAGGALVVIGVWQAGIGRKRIRAEGAWLVIAVGSVVSTLGFVASNILPHVSIISAEIGYFMGVVGAGLLIGGVVKISVGQTGQSTDRSTGTLVRRLHWSTGEEAAAVVLVSILVLAVLFLGLIVYSSSAGCGAFGPAPCPPREALTIESSRVNTPTNLTISIRNTGTAAAALIGYYVKDAAGDLYGNTNWWSGPSILPNALIPTVITIDGNAFTFQTGNSYTIIVITSRYNRFNFTVIA